MDEFDSKKCMEELIGRFENTGNLITLGDKGSIYSDGKIKIEQSVVKTEVVDTTAAGDTFTGYFVRGILAAKEMETVIKEATVASSITVSRIGAAPSIPEMREVKEKYNSL